MQESSLAPTLGFPPNMTRQEQMAASQRRVVLRLDAAPPTVVVTDSNDELYPHWVFEEPRETTPGVSTEIRPGVFTLGADFNIVYVHFFFKWTRTGPGNPPWSVIVKLGRDLGLVTEVVIGSVVADVTAAASANQLEARIDDQLEFGLEQVPELEIAMFLAIPPGTSNQDVDGDQATAWFASNGVPPL